MARTLLARRKSKGLRSTDPVTFVEDALGCLAWTRQADILRAVQKHKRVAVRSGHKVSKSHSAVCLGLWFLHTFPYARVIMTATTNAQIKNVLWRELRIRASEANIAFPTVPLLPHTGMMTLDGKREIVGISTKEPERMAGFSSPNLLYIVDEASGVPKEIFEAIEGNRAGGAHIVMFSNPTQPAGDFYDAFHSQSEYWHTIHVSSWEAANFEPHIPGTATKEWCEEKLKEWGENDPRYQVRVLGNFADSAECSVIPLSQVMAAQQRYEDRDDNVRELGRLELGVDPARFGDDETVIVVRRGNWVMEIIARSKLDENAVSDLVLRTAAKHRFKGERKPVVKVDECGVGFGVLSILRQAEGIDAIGVAGNDPAVMSDEYTNARTELWFKLGEWLAGGGCIPKVQKLEEDLLAPMYDFDAKDRVRVEKKDEIKKRLGGRSPDYADALALAVYSPRIRLVHQLSGNPRSNRRGRGERYRMGGFGRGF